MAEGHDEEQSDEGFRYDVAMRQADA